MDRQFDIAKAVLARNIKQMRAELGLSQEGLALSAEVDRTYVSQIERAVGNPSLLILCKLAGILAVSVPELFDSYAVDEVASQKIGPVRRRKV